MSRSPAECGGDVDPWIGPTSRHVEAHRLDLARHLPSITSERRRAVLLWLLTPVAICLVCELPVYPTDPRAVDPAADPDELDPDILHLDCAAQRAGDAYDQVTA
jgi:hypothetical protein